MKSSYFTKILILVTGFPVYGFGATIEAVNGKITSMRTSSEYHESVPAGAERETIFKLNSAHAGCAWLGIKNSENAFVSMLLSAQAQSKEIKVWYYTDKFSPVWNGAVCQAITIEVN